MSELKGFIAYDKASRRRSGTTPTVSVQKAGFIGINKAAVEVWGQTPDYVNILYNPDTKQIALRGSDISDSTALKVRYNASGTAQVNAQGFLQLHNIDHSVIRHYEPEFVKGIILISLENLKDK